MTELSYRVVDVFAERSFAGNGLCVVGGILDDAATMQRIARAMNLSETVFVAAIGTAEYEARIFTPNAELPIAGHPTLGAAWTMGVGRWTQRSPGGEVVVEVTDGHATMHHPDPSLTEVYPDDAARAMGIPEGAARTAFVLDLMGTRHLVVPTDHPLGRVRFDVAAGAAAVRAVGATGIAAMALVDDTTVKVRLAAPAEGGSFEDPGTGSAACGVGLVARRLWGLGPHLVIRQGEEVRRPCRIDVHAEPGDTWIRGAVRPFAAGALTFS